MLRSLMLIAALACLAPSLSLAQQDDSILVDAFITTQEFVDAEVVRVNPASRTITVRGASRGQTRTFSVPEGSRISVNGRDARLRDILRGDEVRLTVRPRTEEVVIERIRVPATSISLETRQATPISPAPPVQETTPLVAEARPTVLPKTASTLPLILLLGIAALLAASLLRARSSGNA